MNTYEYYYIYICHRDFFDQLVALERVTYDCQIILIDRLQYLSCIYLKEFTFIGRLLMDVY